MRILFAVALLLWLGVVPDTHAQQVNVTRSFSGQVYWVGAVRRGASVYSDRDYIFGDYPDCLEGRPYLITPNKDKFTRGSALIELTVGESSVTLIGYDSRYRSMPGWLTQHFDPLADTVTVMDRGARRTVLTFRLWRSKTDLSYQVLGGNLAPGETANNAMYVAVFLPRGQRNCVR